jgi:membrane-bound lytic murein transglycosylase D
MLKKKKTVRCLIFCLSIAVSFAISFTFFADRVYSSEPHDNNGIEKKYDPVSTGNAGVTVKQDIVSDPDTKHTKTKMEVEEEQDLMEKALELLEMADGFWKKGDIENTLTNLDKAYALVLDTNGDIEIARQKDDLRLLISRRILALYSSQQTKTNGKASEVPLLMNPDVEKEIRSFQTGEREFFISSYQRSALYREIILRELRKAGMPEELFWLPLVESGFKVSALSRARALGLWQFIPSTGYKFGMMRDEWIDERMDILKSTLAAIAYLKELHGMFGDWLTVLAAYNCGEGRVLRVISRQHINYFDRFWDLYNQLPNETARYVPRFLATLHIIKDPAKYGFDLKMAPDTSLNYETVKVNKMMRLSDIAAKIEVSEDVVNILNAELRYKTTPNRVYELKIPKETLQKFNMVFSDIPEAERPRFTYGHLSYMKHRVRAGETVASIAKRYRVTTENVCDANRINTQKKLSRGQVIRIPVYRGETVGPKQKFAAQKSVAADRSNTVVSNTTYKVKPGDSLLGIANKFNVNVIRLKEVNHLKTNVIQAGRILKLPPAEVGSTNDDKQDGKKKLAVESSTAGKTKIEGKTLTADDVAQLGTNKHIVTRGDNLSVIARKYNVELAKLIKWNSLQDETLTPGQILIVRQ